MTLARMSLAHLAAEVGSQVNEDGACRVVGVDGRSGSGKSGFAVRLAEELSAPVISTDELVPGWDGLEASIGLLVAWVLEPIARRQPSQWRRYDWSRDAPGSWVDVPRGQALVVEGCGVGVPASAKYLSYLVWVDAPEPVRRRRLERRNDWLEYGPFYARWARQEDDLFAGAGALERANLVVDNSLERRAGWGDWFFTRKVDRSWATKL